MQTSNLANAMRPRRLAEYIGQDSITSSLRGMLKSKKLPATIMIHGMTGCGKTTLANLIARYANCEKGTACGKCLSCKQMNSGTHPDFLQLDMGANGRIENIRNLLESINFAPTYKKRVILLEEAHAITTASANALLVTIENPPPDTIFVMCTTEPQKMLPTIVGRATQFAVKPVEVETLTENLWRVVEQSVDKKILTKHEEDIGKLLTRISELSGGSVRNSITLLSSVIDSFADFDFDSAIEVVARSGDGNIGEAASDMIVGFLSMDLVAVIRALRSCDNQIALIEKSRWILHALIGNVAGANKFVSAEAKRTLQLLSKGRVKYTAVPCIYLQHALCDAQTKILTVGINAGVQLETAITYLMTRIYEGKLTLKVSDETETPETQERGDVQRRRTPARRTPARNS